MSGYFGADYGVACGAPSALKMFFGYRRQRIADVFGTIFFFKERIAS